VFIVAGWCALLVGAAVAQTRVPSPVQPAPSPVAPIAATATPSLDTYRPMLDRYCVTCHNDRAKTGGLSLAGQNLKDVVADAPTWEKVIRKLNAGMMPPGGMPRPDSAASQAFVSALTTAID